MTLLVISSFRLLPSLTQTKPNKKHIFVYYRCLWFKTDTLHLLSSAWSTEKEEMIKCRHFTIIKLSYPQLAVRGGRQLPKRQIKRPWRCFSWCWLDVGYKAVWLSLLVRTLPLLRQRSDQLAMNASRLKKSMLAWWRLQGLFTASSCLRPCNEERGTLINISDPSSWHVSFHSARKQASKKGQRCY